MMCTFEIVYYKLNFLDRRARSSQAFLFFKSILYRGLIE